MNIEGIGRETHYAGQWNVANASFVGFKAGTPQEYGTYGPTRLQLQLPFEV